MDLESKLNEPNESIPSLNSDAEDAEDADSDDLNSSIEALDWDDIDAELAESGAEAFAKVMESLKGSFTASQIEIPIPTVAPVETPKINGSSMQIPVESTQDVPVEEIPAEEVPEAQVEEEKPESEYGSGDVTSNAPVLDDGVGLLVFLLTLESF